MENQSPRYYKKEKATTIVLFIHGIVEGPDQFLELMEWASELGFSAASLLLPGHGGTGKEFARCSKAQWLAHVEANVLHYKRLYQRVILVGHSMGTLLSFINYTQSPGQIAGIVAIASPLYIGVKKRAIRNNLKVGFSSKLAPDDPAQALLKASSVAPCPVFTYLTWAPRIIDLFLLMSNTRKILHRVTVPTLVIHADKDELVSASSLKVYKRTIPATCLQIVRLPESTHFEYKGNDRERLREAFTGFLKQVSSESSSSVAG